MRTATSLALAAICPLALIVGCANARLVEGKALVASEAAVEASATAAAANAAAMSPAQRAKVKAALDSADSAVVAAHAAYVSGKPK